MSFITLDFETSFSTGKVNPEKFSLSNLTYEEYIQHETFFVSGVGIKIDDQPATWHGLKHENLTDLLTDLFPPSNTHTMLAHNTMFDAAILEWHYGLSASTYLCTLMMSVGLWRYESKSLKNLAVRLWPMNKKMRKGNELALADGLLTQEEYTDEILNYLGAYCIQDCELTFEAFKAMYPHYPDEELEVIDDTIKAFAQRPMILDEALVRSYQKELAESREKIFAASGYSRDLLASSDKFVAMMKRDHNIEIKKVPSPTLKNPKNMKYPLAKDDVSFIYLQHDHPELQHVFDGRIAAASNQETSRCERFLAHGGKNEYNPEGRIAIPLLYCGAGTTRFSGTNSINMQNLGRKSKLRHALTTGDDDHTLVIVDQSNIEGRMNAFHAGADWKLEAFANGADLYNDLATDVFGYPVDRNYEDENGNKPFESEGMMGKTGELGLGFGMGPPKFLTTCHKGPMGSPPMLWVTEDLSTTTVHTWRGKNTEIVNSWGIADNFLEMMASDMKPIEWNTVIIHHQGFQLPNGLSVQYPRLKYDKSPFPNKDGSPKWTWMYWNGKHWQDIWGGIVINNIVQGISRCILTQAEVRIKARFKQANIPGQMVMTIHDELIYRILKAAAEDAMAIIQEEMERIPSWCDNRLVLKAVPKLSPYYTK